MIIFLDIHSRFDPEGSINATLFLGAGSAVVVMPRSRTTSCQAGLTVNRMLLGRST